MKSKELAWAAAKVAAEKRADSITIIDLRKFSAPAEFYIVASASSEPHLKAIADHLENELRKTGNICTHRDGTSGSEWFVLDYFDIIVHLFSKNKREYYNIEDLYADAPQHNFEESEIAPAPKGAKTPKKAPAKKTTKKSVKKVTKKAK